MKLTNEMIEILNELEYVIRIVPNSTKTDFLVIIQASHEDSVLEELKENNDEESKKLLNLLNNADSVRINSVDSAWY